ncbi:MAG TPA: hypothetical protein VFA20_29515 [Myxococcaceae bacterium]|nr:hypothetical protein [Myxococcaceae bacterium]
MSPRAELARFIDELETEPGDYERIAPEPQTLLQVLLPDGARPRRTLFVTKYMILIRCMTEKLLPDGTVVLHKYGLPTATYRREIGACLSKVRPAIFLGDLDPLDLHVYLTLRKDAVELRYGGLNDACLELCERNFKKGRLLFDAPTIGMGPMERRHFSILDSMVDVAALIGPRSRDLLRSGRKLELEGATNPHYFKRGHVEGLLSLVFRATRTAAPAPAPRA